MSDEITKYQVHQLYKNSFFSQKIIANELGIWNSFSDEEKKFYESISHRDSLINQIPVEKKYDQKHVYGEIKQSGVENLLIALESLTDLTDKSFYDFGSGNGKIILHLALISKIKRLVGIELSPIRYKYSLNIMERCLPENIKNNVHFLNIDFQEFDVRYCDIIFINDVCMSGMTEKIFSKMKPGSLIISSNSRLLTFKPIKSVKCQVTWKDTDKPYYIYKK